MTQDIADDEILSKKQSAGGTHLVRQHLWRKWTLQIDAIMGRKLERAVSVAKPIEGPVPLRRFFRQLLATVIAGAGRQKSGNWTPPTTMSTTINNNLQQPTT